MKNGIIKSVSILFIILLSSMSIFTPTVKGVENPYGEKSWRWEDTPTMKIIHDNGTDLVVKRPGEEYKYIQAEVVSEEEGWAEIRITWEEVDPDSYYDRYKKYWSDHDVPDVDNLTFMVKKSTNIAYFKKTDEVFGFNPFYIYNYTDYSVLKDEHMRQLDLYRTIEVSHCHWGSGRPGYLLFRSPNDQIEFVNAIPIFTTNTTQDRCFVDLLSKGHYVATLTTFIPAEYLIDNVTTEEYIWLNANVPKDSEAADFLETINTSAGANTDPTDEDGSTPTSSSGLPSSVLIAILAVLVTFSSIAGYLGYRKRR